MTYIVDCLRFSIPFGISYEEFICRFLCKNSIENFSIFREFPQFQFQSNVYKKTDIFLKFGESMGFWMRIVREAHSNFDVSQEKRPIYRIVFYCIPSEVLLNMKN